MLRTLFVLSLTIFGAAASLRGPFFALLFYLWVAYFRPESWIYGTWFVTANISMLAGVFLILRAMVSDERFDFSFGSILLTAALLHFGVSTLLSPWRDAIGGMYVNFVKTALISWFIMGLAKDVGRFRLVLTIIGLSLGAEAAKQGWAYLVLYPGTTNNNDIPFLGDNNAVAVGLFMLVPVQLALAETSTRKLERYLWIFLAIGVGYRALSTYSRGGFLTAGVLILVYLVRSKRHRIRRALITATATAVLLWTMPDAFWERMDTINAEEDERDFSQEGRLHFWQVGAAMARANPIFGVGHSAYNSAYNDYDTSDGAFGRSRSVHSVWFGLMSEVGYVGLALVLLAFGYAILTCTRTIRQLPRGDPCIAYATALQTALLAFAVGGAFVPLQYNEMFWHFLALSFTTRALVAQQAATEATPEPMLVPPVLLDCHPATRDLFGGTRTPAAPAAAPIKGRLLQPARPANPGSPV